MKRRDFLKTSAAVGLAALTFDKMQAALDSSGIVAIEAESAPDLVAVMGGEPEELLQTALKELGGIEKYVKKGQTVVIKPNIGWDKKPEFAATTNPELIGELVKQCINAGAKKVSVFDCTCDNWIKCYATSGVKEAVEAAGGVMLPANDASYYREVKLPKGVKLKTGKIHQAIIEADVWFNVPILKHHDGANMSIAMKNYMGIYYDRASWHNIDLQQCIADGCTYSKKPALNIIDAYRVLRTHGPQGRSRADASALKAIVISPDIVAADTAAMGLFNQVQEMDIKRVGHIAYGEKLKLGTQNLKNLNVKRIKL